MSWVILRGDDHPAELGEHVGERGVVLVRYQGERWRCSSTSPGSCPESAYQMIVSVIARNWNGTVRCTAFLNSPQAAILGVGRVAERPVARNRAVIVAPTVTLTPCVRPPGG